METSKYKHRKLLLFKAVISVLTFPVASEIFCRFFLKEQLGLVRDERNLTYRYDSELGWFPQENSIKTYTGSRKISVSHNALGFRDKEFSPKKGKRIVFVGDSFVWGYDVEVNERFTEILSEMLPDLEILNLGVSGYGTDQQYLLIKRFFKKLDPDIVFLVFSHNDRMDNSLNNNYNGYYKPFFTMENGGMLLNGVPVPKSANYFFYEHNILSYSFFVRAVTLLYYEAFETPFLPFQDNSILTESIIFQMNKFVKENGARLIVGGQVEDSRLESFLRKSNIEHVDLRNFYVYKSHGNHWTPDGHKYVAEKIRDVLGVN